MADLMTDGRIDSVKLGQVIAGIKQDARAAARVLGYNRALEPALARMSDLVYEVAELVKAERALRDGEGDTSAKVTRDHADAMARRALMIFRQDTTAHAHGGPGDYQATELAVAAYARAAGIGYNAALKATLDAYRSYYGSAELNTDMRRMGSAVNPLGS